MKTYLNCFALRAKMAAKKFFTNERGDVNVVSIVVLIAVAVFLAILLKGQLSNVINNLVNGISSKSNTILE